MGFWVNFFEYRLVERKDRVSDWELINVRKSDTR